MSRTVSAWLLFGLLLLAVAGLAAGAGAQGNNPPAEWQEPSLAPPSGPSYVHQLFARRPTIVSGPLELFVGGWAVCPQPLVQEQIGFSITVDLGSDGGFSFEGVTSTPVEKRNVVSSISGHLTGTTLSGVVRMRGDIVGALSGATCIFDTGNTAFTSTCTINCTAQAPPKPPPPKPGDGSRPGDGLIVPFRSIGGAKLGMTLGQLKAVLGRPTIEKCGGAYWRDHGLRIWLKPCKGGAYLLEHQKSGGQLRYPKRTSTGGGLGTRDARMKAAFSPARFRCRSSEIFVAPGSRNGRLCQARQMIRGKAFITSWASTNQIVTYVNIYRCKNTNPGVTGQLRPGAEIWEPCGSDFFTAQLRYPPRG